VWLAVRAGFTEAARYSQYNHIRAARNALKVIEGETRANVAQLKRLREEMKTKRVAEIDLRTDSIRQGASKSYAALLDPALLCEVERLFAFPMSDVEELLRRPGRLADEERDQISKICTRVIDRAEKVVIPMIEAQDRELESVERRLREAP
jgi:hypothetical protein